MAIWRRRGDLDGLVHHSDRGSQYTSIRYTERLAEAGIAPSVGSVGDCYDNAMAESVIGLYKTELIRMRGPWKGIDDVEYATLEWVDWFNHRRLLESIGHVPPAEFEAAYYRGLEQVAEIEVPAEGLNAPDPRSTPDANGALRGAGSLVLRPDGESRASGDGSSPLVSGARRREDRREVGDYRTNAEIQAPESP